MPGACFVVILGVLSSGVCIDLVKYLKFGDLNFCSRVFVTQISAADCLTYCLLSGRKMLPKICL